MMTVIHRCPEIEAHLVFANLALALGQNPYQAAFLLREYLLRHVLSGFFPVNRVLHMRLSFSHPCLAGNY